MFFVLFKISGPENIENHVEALEKRISELSRENSGYFRTKLKLQERLEFIMQERDVQIKSIYVLLKAKIFYNLLIYF